ncbi:sensor histidine kinase [Ferruginibacter yonginensis]|uniref:histidine kinase n=1 Tax=Ferruginibacter yonginensis TaxID=1310416 RepID=A0ABV8QSY4_9BACT
MQLKKNKIQKVIIIYWVLLAYIIAALVWWFIALGRQNEQMSQYKIQDLHKDDFLYTEKYNAIIKAKNVKTAQYVGEGGTFLLLILAGAIFVFRAVRRELRLTRDQQNFMMAITHELKTPISVAKLNLETLQKHKLAETQQQRLLYNTLQETNRLDTLCTNLLVSSQIDGGGYKATNDEQDFSFIVNDCVDRFITRFSNRIIEKDIATEVFVNGDAFLLQIAISNLIENAIKYAPKEKPIVVKLLKQQNQAILQVVDEGPGIAEADKQQVFEKFYRVGNEATKRAKGTGLGLYLTSRIALAHKGKIAVENNPKGGSIFILSLQAEA